jgi:hypothetical protein
LFYPFSLQPPIEQSESSAVLIQKEPPTVAIAGLADEVSELKSQIKSLVSQVQLIRQELQK